MALNCVKAGVGCGACKRQNIHIPNPLSLTLTAELGATNARPDQARHSATLGPSAGVQGPHPGSTGAPRGSRHGSLRPRPDARHHRVGSIGGCPRSSSWERRRPRRPITTYCKASHRHACRFRRKCVNSHLIGSCETLPAGAHTLPGGSPCVTSCSPRRRHHPRGPVGGCPRTSSWERRRPRRPITPYSEAFHGHACQIGRKCGNSHLIASCETMLAGAPALPGGLTTGHFVLAPDSVTATLGIGAKSGGSGTAGRDAR